VWELSERDTEAGLDDQRPEQNEPGDADPIGDLQLSRKSKFGHRAAALAGVIFTAGAAVSAPSGLFDTHSCISADFTSTWPK
jgi:hypothetical protein